MKTKLCILFVFFLGILMACNEQEDDFLLDEVAANIGDPIPWNPIPKNPNTKDTSLLVLGPYYDSSIVSERGYEMQLCLLKTTTLSRNLDIQLKVHPIDGPTLLPELGFAYYTIPAGQKYVNIVLPFAYKPVYDNPFSDDKKLVGYERLNVRVSIKYLIYNGSEEIYHDTSVYFVKYMKGDIHDYETTAIESITVVSHGDMVNYKDPNDFYDFGLDNGDDGKDDGGFGNPIDIGGEDGGGKEKPKLPIN